jgi:hypothetical protein
MYFIYSAFNKNIKKNIEKSRCLDLKRLGLRACPNRERPCTCEPSRLNLQDTSPLFFLILKGKQQVFLLFIYF